MSNDIYDHMQVSAQARLFIALWPDDIVRRSLADYRDACHWQGRPALARDAKLHITLHFLGNVAHARVPGLRAALTAPCAAFDLAFGHPALWTRGVAVIEPLAIPDELRALHAGLKEAICSLGLPVEARPFRPHITLARHARQVDFPAQALKAIWRVEEYALLESKTDTGEYRMLERYPVVSDT